MSCKRSRGDSRLGCPAECSSAATSADDGGETMKCEWVQENILLHIYNELPDDARYELEQHVARCTDCAAELKAARQLHATLSQFPVRGAFSQSGDRVAHAVAGRARNHRAGRLLAAPGVRPGCVASSHQAGSGAGRGDLHRGLCRRDWGHVSNDEWPQPGRSLPLRCSHGIFHHRHPVHLRNSLAHLKSASATTQFPPRKRRDRSTISASSSCCCSLPATTTTPACAWIQWIC